MSVMERLLFLRIRAELPEIMDNPFCDRVLLERTIDQFALVNRLFTASRYLIQRYLFPHIAACGNRTVTLLDIGCGGCDIDIWIVREARKRGMNIAVTAVDHDARIIDMAKRKTEEYPEITLVHGNIASLSEMGPWDVAFSNHFLHHLDEPSLTELFQRLFSITRRAFLMNDLRRSLWAYLGYGPFAFFFLRGSFALPDGMVSIRRGFTRKEWNDFLASRFHGKHISIISAFPARLAVYWENEGKAA